VSERADVNAEFKCTCETTHEFFSIAQATFDFTALIWQVAAAITREWFPAFPATAD